MKLSWKPSDNYVYHLIIVIFSTVIVILSVEFMCQHLNKFFFDANRVCVEDYVTICQYRVESSVTFLYKANYVQYGSVWEILHIETARPIFFLAYII